MPTAEYMRAWRARNGKSQERQKKLEKLRHQALRKLAELYPEEFLRIFNRLKEEANLNDRPD